MSLGKINERIMITRVLSLLLVTALFSSVFWNRSFLEDYSRSLSMSADASSAVDRMLEKDTLKHIPQVITTEKMDQEEMTTQIRVGYFLLRGF